jgi:hypothetical protein
MAHVRGLHETCGLQALHVVRNKAQPGQLAAKLARLDHQRELLKRQLAVWTEKQQVTRNRLSLVEKQMAELGRLVRQFGTPRRAAGRRSQLGSIAPAKTADDGAAAPRRQNVNIEY